MIFCKKSYLHPILTNRSAARDDPRTIVSEVNTFATKLGHEVELTLTHVPRLCYVVRSKSPPNKSIRGYMSHCLVISSSSRLKWLEMSVASAKRSRLEMHP